MSGKISLKLLVSLYASISFLFSFFGTSSLTLLNILKRLNDKKNHRNYPEQILLDVFQSIQSGFCYLIIGTLLIYDVSFLP